MMPHLAEECWAALGHTALGRGGLAGGRSDLWSRIRITLAGAGERQEAGGPVIARDADQADDRGGDAGARTGPARACRQGAEEDHRRSAEDRECRGVSPENQSRSGHSPLILPLALGGCFQPLYGPLASGGSLESELQAIAINPILPERLGHYLEGELGFAFNGTGSTVPPKYRLSVTLRERAQAPVIDTVSARATAATIVVDADYILIPVAGGEPITTGHRIQRRDLRPHEPAHFQRAGGRATPRTRNAKVIADAIRTRIAAALASRG